MRPPPPYLLRHRGSAVALAAVAVGVGGCIPASGTVEGQAINDLWKVFIAGGIVVAGIVWGLATWVVLRYRRRSEDDLPTQTRGNTLIETIWTLAPLVTVVLLFVLTVGVLNVTGTSAPDGSVHLDVVAYRWGWQVSYTGTDRQVTGVATQGPEIVLPVNQPVAIRLSSADVNHAFFVPQFLYKRDAIPGRPSSFTITIQAPGTYPGECAEYCGILHDQMPFTIRAVPADQFQSWLAGGSLP